MSALIHHPAGSEAAPALALCCFLCFDNSLNIYTSTHMLVIGSHCVGLLEWLIFTVNVIHDVTVLSQNVYTLRKK